jgi:IS30 family transposase
MRKIIPQKYEKRGDVPKFELEHFFKPFKFDIDERTKELGLDEREFIKKHLDVGLSCSQISLLLKRGKNTVVTEIRRNGGREKYDPKEAQENYFTRKKIGYEKMQEKSKIQDYGPSVRLKNLEFQIEILFDELKKLKEKYDSKHQGI